MSLQAILDAILITGQDQVGEIEEGAYRRIREIRVNAGIDAKQIKDEIADKTAAPAYKERARIFHRARLEALQITGNVRESLVDAAIDQTRGHLEGLRTDAAYPKVLKRLTEDALDELAISLEDPANAKLQADSRDSELLETILREEGLTLDVDYSLICWGGLIAASRDGRVVVINTLESRLERATPNLRRYLAAFFESDDPEKVLSKVADLAVVS